MKAKRIADWLGPLLDVLVVVWVLPASLLLRGVRRFGLSRLKMSRAVLLRVGLLPVRKHYYEPFFPPNELKSSLSLERDLPGIDMNMEGQLNFLARLTFQKEIGDISAGGPGNCEFRLGNGSFESGDAEFLYQVVRLLKPARIVEIGSGNSTRMARAAVKRNGEENPGYQCRHTCIEPFEAPWLESMGVEVLRLRVENVDKKFFRELQRGDLLFIDSSHVIRPQGDVVTEYLEILPILSPGVVVHVHDIFTPRDYPKEWIIDSLLLWNEQYLLEAFLTDNPSWQVIGAVNFLKHRRYESLLEVCPNLTRDREPGSFYIEKRDPERTAD